MTDGPAVNSEGARRLPPEALREALRRDAGPVRPLLPPAARTMIVLAVAGGAAAVLITLAGLRPDRGILDPKLFWAPAVVRVLAGLILILLAMREAVPGSGGPAVVRHTSLFSVPILLTFLTDWVASRSRRGFGNGNAWEQVTGAFGCYPREVLVTIPVLLVIAWFLARAYPLRPIFAAMAGATGAALMADAVLHLTCPMTAMMHTLLVHGGAVVSVALLAAAIGWLVDRRRSGSF